MGDSTIEWTGKTWNAVRGCRHKSAGCKNCYAERVATRFSGPGMPYEGLVTIRPRKDGGVRHPQTGRAVIGARGRWNGKVMFVTKKLLEPLSWKEPTKIFVNSMSDLFYEEFTNEQIAAQFGVMYLAHWHTYQILTKRIERARAWFDWIVADANRARAMTIGMHCAQILLEQFERGSKERARVQRAIDRRMNGEPTETLGAWPLPNVWMGTSVESDAERRRILELLRTPAAIRFISAEPLIGELDVGPYVDPVGYACCGGECYGECLRNWPMDGNGYVRLDWVIVGCESGAGARRCSVDWIRSIVEVCTSSGVAVFVKQAMELRDPQQQMTVGCTPIGAGDGTKRKGKKLLALPYIDGKQYAQFPHGPST